MQLSESEMSQILEVLRSLNMRIQHGVSFIGCIDIWSAGDLLGTLSSVNDDEVFWYYTPVQKASNFASGEVS